MWRPAFAFVARSMEYDLLVQRLIAGQRPHNTADDLGFGIFVIRHR